MTQYAHRTEIKQQQSCFLKLHLPKGNGRTSLNTVRVNSSVQFSRSVVSDSSQPHESQHTKPPCPLPTPGLYSNLCPSSRWCHPTISSSVVPCSSCPQSLPALGSFPMSRLFTWGGQVLEFQLQHQSFLWTPRTDLPWMDWLDLLAVQGTLKSLLQHHSSKASILRC